MLALLFSVAVSLQVQPRLIPLQPSTAEPAEAPVPKPEFSPDRYASELDFPELRKQYWADPRMHGFGNQDSLGAKFHAFVAPAFTYMLDQFAYHGINVRQAAWRLVEAARKAGGAPDVTRAVDLGTGTGFTARALLDFFDAAKIVGLDTSEDMLKVARHLNQVYNTGIDYKLANAEKTGLPSSKFDVAVASFVFHECPREARLKILEEGLRLLRPGGTLAVLDIHTDYEPSQFMLPGEPYIRGYLDNFEDDARVFVAHNAHRFAAAYRDVVVKGRLCLWHFHLKRSP